MRTKLVVALAGMGLFLAGTVLPLSAHHAFSAEFDAKKPVTFKGQVTKMEWTNPHVWIHIDAKKPDGAVESWAIEAGGPTSLFRRGFTKASLAVGTETALTAINPRTGPTG